MALPKTFHYQNFITAFQDANMGTFLLNSVIVTAIALLLLLALALPASYVLARFNFKGRKFLNGAFMAGLFVKHQLHCSADFLDVKFCKQSVGSRVSF